MNHQEPSREQLATELAELRRRVAILEESERFNKTIISSVAEGVLPAVQGFEDQKFGDTSATVSFQDAEYHHPGGLHATHGTKSIDVIRPANAGCFSRPGRKEWNSRKPTDLAGVGVTSGSPGSPVVSGSPDPPTPRIHRTLEAAVPTGYNKGLLKEWLTKRCFLPSPPMNCNVTDRPVDWTPCRRAAVGCAGAFGILLARHVRSGKGARCSL